MKAFAGLLACAVLLGFGLPACGGVAERQTEQAALPASESTAPVQPGPIATAPALTVDEPAPVDAPEFQGNGNVNGGAPQGSVECTLVGCRDGFEVRFERSTAWESGSYRLRLLEDGQETADCNVVVPEANAGEAIRHDCPRGLLTFITGEGEPPPIWGAWVRVVADRIELEVADGDQQLAHAEYVPDWRESRPNGPQCGPVCMTAPGETLVFE